jgi:low affinity Fe/Cu permease
VKARHPTERGTPGERGRFDRVAQAASNFTSSPTFFVTCIVVVALWLGTHVAGLSTELQHLTGDAMAAITLLLLALLKNSELRAEHAIQRKRNAITTPPTDPRQGKTREAHDALEEAIGMHEEV